MKEITHIKGIDETLAEDLLIQARKVGYTIVPNLQPETN